jgi:hypothetical protein
MAGGESSGGRSVAAVPGEAVVGEAAECSGDGVVCEVEVGGDVAYGSVGHGRRAVDDGVLGQCFEDGPRDGSDVASHPWR